MQQRLIECQGFKNATKKKLTWVWKDLESFRKWRRDALNAIIHLVTKHRRNASTCHPFTVLNGTIWCVRQWCKTEEFLGTAAWRQQTHTNDKYHNVMYEVTMTERTHWWVSCKTFRSSLDERVTYKIRLIIKSWPDVVVTNGHSATTAFLHGRRSELWTWTNRLDPESELLWWKLETAWNLHTIIYILQLVTIAYTSWHNDPINVAKAPLDCSTVSWRAWLLLNKFAPQQNEHRGNFSARSETSDQKGTVFHKPSVRPHLSAKETGSRWHTIGNYARTQLSLMVCTPDPTNISCMSCM